MPDILKYLKQRAEADVPEADPEEATAEDYENALAELGVNLDEENEAE